MPANQTTLQAFFHEFQQRNASGGVPAIVAQFADTFLAAGPQGSNCIQAADFALALPKRKTLFDSMGHASTELLSLNELPLGTRYVLARTLWRMTFQRNASEPLYLEVESVFLVDTGAEPFKIVVYLACQDIFELLRQRGITPA